MRSNAQKRPLLKPPTWVPARKLRLCQQHFKLCGGGRLQRRRLALKEPFGVLLAAAWSPVLLRARGTRPHVPGPHVHAKSSLDVKPLLTIKPCALLAGAATPPKPANMSMSALAAGVAAPLRTAWLWRRPSVLYWRPAQSPARLRARGTRRCTLPQPPRMRRWLPCCSPREYAQHPRQLFTWACSASVDHC